MVAETQVESVAGLEVRRRAPADRDSLVAMYASFEPKGACLGLPPRQNPERWIDGLVDYPNFLIKLDDRVVAHGALCIENATAEIAVFVHQEFRGRGLGKRLLRAMLDHAERVGLERVWGMTELDNVPMLRLARSLGFVPGADPREFYIDLRAQARSEEFTTT